MKTKSNRCNLPEARKMTYDGLSRTAICSTMPVSKIVLVFVLSLAIVSITNSHDDAFAYQTSSSPSYYGSSSSSSTTTVQTPTQSSTVLSPSQTQPNIFFMNIHVDPNPLPNVPFKIYVDLSSQNPSDLFAHIQVPDGMSVLGSIVPALTTSPTGNYQRASWTVMAGSPGTYAITISVHSNFPTDTETLTLSANVGSPNSLIVTGINIPGNITLNDQFKVGITLKNSANFKDNDVLARISVPAGLQLLSSGSSPSFSMDPNNIRTIEWDLRAQSSGSFPIVFNYSSINSGTSFVKANVNVGTVLTATGGLLSISARPVLLIQNDITPVIFDVKNNVNSPIHNLQIASASGGTLTSVGTPAWVGDLDANAKKSITVKIFAANGTLPLTVPVVVKYDTGAISYDETYLTELPLKNPPNFKINSVAVTPSLSYAGDTAVKIDVQLFNLGQGANDVYTKLNLPDGISPAWGNATTVYFGRIDNFQTVTASYYVNLNDSLTAGNHPLLLEVTAASQKTNLVVNLVVAPKAQFRILGVDDSQIYPGASNVPFTITLKNIGNFTADAVTVKLLAGNAIPGVKNVDITTVGNVDNVGTVLPGQSFTAVFYVDIDLNSNPGEKDGNLELDWDQGTVTVNGQNTFVQGVSLPYNISKGPWYAEYYYGVPLTYVGLGAAAIVLTAIFIRKRRKRLKLIAESSLTDYSKPAFESQEIKPISETAGTINLDITKKEDPGKV